MAYKISLPSETMQKLFLLKTYCAEPAIIEQVRCAVRDYLEKKELEIGCPISDIQETRERHKKEDWRVKLESQIQDRNRRLSKKIY